VLADQFCFPRVWFVCRTRSWENAIPARGFDCVMFFHGRCQPFISWIFAFAWSGPLMWTVLRLFKEFFLVFLHNSSFFFGIVA